jgi:hypothetical protein
MRKFVFIAFLFVIAGVLHAQHGSAGEGYFHIGYAGDTWSGEVTLTNDANREITLVYNGRKKTETFVGVLRQGITAKPSMFQAGTRLKVYYSVKDWKVDGRKETFNEIFQFNILTN